MEVARPMERAGSREEDAVKRTLPAGSWDCHAHVIELGDRFPLAPGRSYDPPQASLQDYLAFLDRHGLARGVLVQPSVYGFDNRCMLEALDQAGGRLLGVAVPHPGSSAADLQALHLRGVRAVRCNLLNPGGLDPEVVAGWQPTLHDLGWHLEFHVDVGKVGDLRAFLAPFTVPVVFDHMGRPEQIRRSEKGDWAPRLGQLLELVREGRCFAKLSAPYRVSDGPPPWSDLAPLARAFLEVNPAACVWATDWPNVDTNDPVREEDLFTALDDWSLDLEARHALLSVTPGKLYDSV